MNKAVCKECLFWISRDTPLGEITNSGYCHGGPPSVLWSKVEEDKIVTIWPITFENEGCGMFYSKEMEKKENAKDV